MKTIAWSTTLLTLAIIGCGESRPPTSVPAAVATPSDGDHLSANLVADDPHLQLVKLELPGMT
jgi:hypothetical protein